MVTYLRCSGRTDGVRAARVGVGAAVVPTVRTRTGRFVTGIVGADPRPSLDQLALRVAYLVPVTLALTVGAHLQLPRPRRHTAA